MVLCATRLKIGHEDEDSLLASSHFQFKILVSSHEDDKAKPPSTWYSVTNGFPYARGTLQFI